jgi:hypothetical protein
MRTYEVTFSSSNSNGYSLTIVVRAISTWDAQKMVESNFPGCKVSRVTSIDN